MGNIERESVCVCGVCVCISAVKGLSSEIKVINISSIYIIYSPLHKYWNSKDKMALLAVESRHLQI